MNEYYEKRFFELMDRLVEWHKNKKSMPIEPLSIAVMQMHSTDYYKEITIVGTIDSSENDIRRAMMSKAPSDRAFIEEMTEWFELGTPYDGAYPAFYQTIRIDTIGTSGNISGIVSDLQKKCNERYEGMEIKFYIPDNSSGACYIATCIYGSYDCPEVWTLRRFRDYTLLKSWLGRSFVHIYYATSPTIIKWFGHTAWFNHFWKGTLNRMTKHLQKKGYEDTPYYDR